MLKKILRVVFYVFVAVLLLFLLMAWTFQVNSWFHLGIPLSILLGVAIFFFLMGIGWLFGNLMDWLFR